ncbi:hypothetical protein [Nostoc sp.]|uniref:hypothetical protein n=1 Tax=Nostoc sp. TaxID=1180 RepID=UPI002FF5F694
MARSCALALKRNYEPVMIICAYLLRGVHLYALTVEFIILQRFLAEVLTYQSDRYHLFSM